MAAGGASELLPEGRLGNYPGMLVRRAVENATVSS
jgi:hypothetical protein